METLRLSSTGAVTTVTLARPKVHNAFNPTMIRELTQTFAELGADPAVRAVVLAADGKSFSAGGDLHWIQRTADYSQADNEADALRMARMFQTLDACPKPVVVRVQGAALGGGVGLVACGDVVVAAERVVFGLTEVRLGVIPAVISPFVLPKIGVGQARRFFLSGERFDAATAQQIGLVHQVVPAERLEEAVAAHLSNLWRGGPHALAEAKRLIPQVVGREPVELGPLTAQTFARLRVSPEGQEGIRAFFDRRPPAWTEGEQ